MQSAEGLEEQEDQISAGQQAGPSDAPGAPSQGQEAGTLGKKKAGKTKVGFLLCPIVV